MSPRFQLPVVLAALLMLSGCGEPKESLAESTARDYVKEHLRSPTSAQFQKFITCAKTTEGKYFIFYISVDATNAFGALVRAQFLVLVKDSDTDNPQVVTQEECSVECKKWEVQALAATVPIPDANWLYIGFK